MLHEVGAGGRGWSFGFCHGDHEPRTVIDAHMDEVCRLIIEVKGSHDITGHDIEGCYAAHGAGTDRTSGDPAEAIAEETLLHKGGSVTR